MMAPFLAPCVLPGLVEAGRWLHTRLRNWAIQRQRRSFFSYETHSITCHRDTQSPLTPARGWLWGRVAAWLVRHDLAVTRRRWKWFGPFSPRRRDAEGNVTCPPSWSSCSSWSNPRYIHHEGHEGHEAPSQRTESLNSRAGSPCHLIRYPPSFRAVCGFARGHSSVSPPSPGGAYFQARS